MADGIISKIQLPDNTIYDVVDNTSGYMTGMTILSYGSSTWQNFIDAYSSNKVVYCRASSNSNPATGSQTRLAFMAYVNNATTPTEVEFQYYRSVSTHTASQQGDQVYVYKLNKTNGWSVTIREASVKVVAGTGLGGTYSKGTMTLTGPTKVSDLTNDSGFLTSSSTLDASKLSGTIPSNCYTDTNTTYTLSNALSSHKFTSTLTAGGSGSGTSTATMEFVAGTGITLTDDTTNKKITIASSVTNTDEKLGLVTVRSGTTYYPIVGKGPDAATRQYDGNGFQYTGTFKSSDYTNYQGYANITLGNSNVTGTAYNQKGVINLYSNTAYSAAIHSTDLTDDRFILLPDKSGTVALTNDIPDVSGKIDTAGTGLSKSGTTLNHSNSVTAQTTQAVYPIKIDAQGHISGYGTAVTIPTVPSKLSDLTNDLIYDLGTVTVNAGVFSVSADDVTAITALWNDGYCALKLTINSIDYYAYKERVITYSGLSFMGFVAVEADINANVIVTGKNLVGINSGGVGMFAFVKDLDNDDVQTTVNNLIGGKQDTLVSGTNIKTINNQSILGSGNITVSTTAAQIIRWTEST